MKNYLAIDYGAKNIGIAYKIGDSPIVPSDIIDNTVPEEVLQHIQTFVQEKNINHIIVGMPYNLKGEVGEQAKTIEAFIQTLAATVPVPIDTTDERFTTQMFPGTLENIDSYSAGAILKSFLARNKT